ncbi:MAG: aconitate hydratase AcnA [Candidatus Thermoplasmatota archaeon]|nr:aconitate hydratase AcnA [Candidatus Thermoplasmatota archaeon]MCL5438288.1 aconitate hydratase AcnA [Candidatus Thermoplasmatota archaeon]
MESTYRIEKKIEVSGKPYHYFSLPDLKENGLDLSRTPYTIRILLESMIRNLDGAKVSEDDVKSLSAGERDNSKEISFKVSRVLMQDLTGVPAVVDLASIREKVKSLGGRPENINPDVAVDLVIDHSVQVDYFGSEDSFEKNRKIEFQRNGERYRFLKWASKAFNNVNIIPPSVGIVHQVNLEFLGKIVTSRTIGEKTYIFPDTLVGTDSHTTMINGIGVLGWGVGGIEAEASMLGEPISMQIPKVVGARLFGKMKPGITATDLVLTLTEIFRKHNVVGKFIEFYGPGVSELPAPDRATISNMCPEYGATVAYFPVDERTLDFLVATGRDESHVELIKSYLKAQGMFGVKEDLAFDEIIEIDLGSIVPTVAGPKLPQQKVPLNQISDSFLAFLESDQSRTSRTKDQVSVYLRKVPMELNGKESSLSDGDVVIAAITSCTNTSNPRVMIAAGLLAKKAVELGLSVNPRVKTSLAPGSRVVSEYLTKSGLQQYLDKLGFYLVGYGCTTCIGNSGPLPEPVQKVLERESLKVVSVLSGNRNFEARIHKDVAANYLMSPPLVVAFAIAGTVNTRLQTDPLGTGKDGKAIYLKDVWPSDIEIEETLNKFLSRESFREKYGNLESYNEAWNAIEVPQGDLYRWEEGSTYIRNPPYFDGFSPDDERTFETISNCMTLGVFGDSVTTDHISPAGSIAKNGPAADYLRSRGVEQSDFNSYGSRRGNHEVMMRGTFANIRIKNSLVNETGGNTILFPEKKQTSIFEASEEYRKRGNNLVVFAGIDYGTGSSRDWAAKGPYLLGVRAAIARSFERIHRSNLVGMGVIPLQFQDGKKYDDLGLDVSMPFSIEFNDTRTPSRAFLKYTNLQGNNAEVELKVRLDTPIEYEYYRKGGILQYVLASLSKT